MIIDAILYNGERDIFDLRYNILKDYVDEFVVVEFGHTFSGNVKEAHPINLPKVSYHFFTQTSKKYTPDMPPAFQEEYNQREMIKNCLMHLHDQDIVFMGDCDEIWDPRALDLINNMKLKLLPYAYYLNNRSNEDFVLGPVKLQYGTLKKWHLNILRSEAKLTDDYYGWHFTNMGGEERLRYKIESYGHQEYNLPEIKDGLKNQIKNNKDYIGRDFKFWLDKSEWPPWLKENEENYKHLIKQNESIQNNT